MEEILIEFQIYLNDKKLITNHDWDFEKMARKFIKSRKVVSKNFIKPAVMPSLPNGKRVLAALKELSDCFTDEERKNMFGNEA
jgi:hypothetical protein